MNLPERLPYTWAAAHDMLDTFDTALPAILREELFKFERGFVLTKRVPGWSLRNLDDVELFYGKTLRDLSRTFLHWIEATPERFLKNNIDGGTKA